MPDREGSIRGGHGGHGGSALPRALDLAPVSLHRQAGLGLLVLVL